MEYDNQASQAVQVQAVDGLDREMEMTNEEILELACKHKLIFESGDSYHIGICGRKQIEAFFNAAYRMGQEEMRERAANSVEDFLGVHAYQRADQVIRAITIDGEKNEQVRD